MKHKKHLEELVEYLAFRCDSFALQDENRNLNYTDFEKRRHVENVNYSVLRSILNTYNKEPLMSGVRCVIFDEHYLKTIILLELELQSKLDILTLDRTEYLNYNLTRHIKNIRSRVIDYNTQIKLHRQRLVVLRYLRLLIEDNSLGAVRKVQG